MLNKGREVRSNSGDTGERHYGGVTLSLVMKSGLSKTGARRELRPPSSPPARGSQRAGDQGTRWREVGSMGPLKDDAKAKRRSSLKSLGSAPPG